MLQFEAPKPITTPIAEQWRALFEQFLREMKVDDQKAKAWLEKPLHLQWAVHGALIQFSFVLRTRVLF